ncbi:MAG: hypothetical protein M3Y54_18515, partial [Bacteroidota bacterium]|nr:hypothetical protein [Bacteroidota bacterium]
LLGPHAGLTSFFWEAIYQSMSGQLSLLSALIDSSVPALGFLPPAVANEASRVVATIDGLVSATMRRR